MVNDKTDINVPGSNGNVVLEKNAQSIVDTKENQFINNKYTKHVMRKGKLEHVLTTGNIEGKKAEVVIE